MNSKILNTRLLKVCNILHIHLENHESTVLGIKFLKSHFSGTESITCTPSTKFNHLINQLTHMSPNIQSIGIILDLKVLKTSFHFISLQTRDWYPPTNLVKFNSLTLFLPKEEGEDFSINFQGLHSNRGRYTGRRSRFAS